MTVSVEFIFLIVLTKIPEKNHLKGGKVCCGFVVLLESLSILAGKA